MLIMNITFLLLKMMNKAKTETFDFLQIFETFVTIFVFDSFSQNNDQKKKDIYSYLHKYLLHSTVTTKISLILVIHIAVVHYTNLKKILNTEQNKIKMKNLQQ